MRRGVIIGAGVVLAAALAAAADEPRGADLRQIEQSLQAVIAKAEPAVACVLAYRHPDPIPDPSHRTADRDDAVRVPDSYGSGVVVTPQGLILTNYHVVRDAKTIYVRLPAGKDADGGDGPSRVSQARIYAADNRSDLAVLQLLSPAGPYPFLPLGVGEKLRKGSLIVSLAHPYAAGYRDGSASASWGIVSNLRRQPPGSGDEFVRASKALSQLGTLIQTDVRLQLGMSGGALVDLDSRLVGLTTAQAALTGVDAPGGFAAPLDANLRRIVEVLLRGEEVEYGFLGVSAARRAATTIQLDTVVHNSPAWQAGLRPGDAILKVNGQPVRDPDDLFLLIGAALAGRRAELLVQRGDREPQPVAVTLVKAPINAPDKLEGVAVQPDGRPAVTRFNATSFGVATSRPKAVYGLRVDYTSVIAGADRVIPAGVVVREAEPNSPAKAALLQEYADVITAVNDRPVHTPAEFYAAARRAAEAGDKVRLTLANRTVSLPN